MKKLSFRTIIIAIAVLAAFSWIWVRPYVDRRDCKDIAVKHVEGYGGPTSDKAFDFYERYYTLCVNGRGLGN